MESNPVDETSMIGTA